MKFLTMSLVILTLIGCGKGDPGATGSTGPQGPTGPQGVPAKIVAATTCNANEVIAGVGMISYYYQLIIYADYEFFISVSITNDVTASSSNYGNGDAAGNIFNTNKIANTMHGDALVGSWIISTAYSTSSGITLPTLTYLNQNLGSHNGHTYTFTKAQCN